MHGVPGCDWGYALVGTTSLLLRMDRNTRIKEQGCFVDSLRLSLIGGLIPGLTGCFVPHSVPGSDRGYALAGTTPFLLHRDRNSRINEHGRFVDDLCLSLIDGLIPGLAPSLTVSSVFGVPGSD